MRWVRRLAGRFDWDRPGVLLAALLFFGEGSAVAWAGYSLASDGYDGGRLAALLGAAVLMLYVPLAIWQEKLPFAAPTEYERRRKYAQKVLDVRIPRTGEKMGDVELGSGQVDLPDSSDESVRAAVGRAYCLGDEAFKLFGAGVRNPELLRKIRDAKLMLVPPSASFGVLTLPIDLMGLPQEPTEPEQE